MAVNILADFQPDDIMGLVGHSDARLLLTDDHTVHTLGESRIASLASLPSLDGTVLLGSLKPVGEPRPRSKALSPPSLSPPKRPRPHPR